MHKYTEEEVAFFRDYYYGHSYKEIQSEFISRFGWNISVSQVRSFGKNHRLTTGRTGRFEKGHVPANKGVPMTPEHYAKCAPTMFKKGIYVPKGNAPLPIGSEIVTADGYVRVKIAQPNSWETKSRLVWEKYYGPIPPGYVVTYKDGNSLNCDIDNLILISRAVSRTMSLHGLTGYKGEAKEIAINIAKLINEKNEAKKRR